MWEAEARNRKQTEGALKLEHLKAKQLHANGGHVDLLGGPTVHSLYCIRQPERGGSPCRRQRFGKG